MGYASHFKDILTIGIIAGLFVVGLSITLKSGVVGMSGDRCALILGNLSRLILTLAGCMLFLSMVQQIVGFRLSLHW